MTGLPPSASQEVVSAHTSPALHRSGLAREVDGLPAGWRAVLEPHLEGAAVRGLAAFLQGLAAGGRTVYPARPFRALHACPLETVRVVVLGQDPYHGPGQADGLAFSVPPGQKIPPSLRNIFAELHRDGLAPPARHGGLEGWARQGVLLLNTVLSVEPGRPGAHAGRGWEVVTDALIDAVARRPTPKVFLLWGRHAQQKEARVRAAAAALAVAPLVLTANHPSPLSARRPPCPFLGCGHFSQANDYLRRQGQVPIDWMA